MANGVYSNGGFDDDNLAGTGTVDSVIPGPIVITKTGDGGGGNTDANVLDLGDNFTIPQLPGVTWSFLGTDGSGGLVAFNATSGAQLWLSDTTITSGQSLPSPNSGGSVTICFAAGTQIATPTGKKTVETLSIGDLVENADGLAVPVKWIGRQTLLKFFAGERACPVRVKAGALGRGLPHTELVLTADHALIIDGLAINAGALVNGTTITRDTIADVPDSITFYHIETEAHDVILANGAPAETFVDYVGRKVFDNYAEYVALYGDEPVIREMPLPRVSSRRQLPADLCARFGIPEFGADVTENAMAFLSKRHIA